MRTTLNLPEKLINEAMLLSNLPTKTAVIIAALDGLVRQSKLSDIKNYGSKVDIDFDLQASRKR